MTVQDQRVWRDSNASNGIVAFATGTAYAGASPVRALFLNCTVAANITVVFSDTTSFTFAVPTGLYEFNWHCTTVTVNSGTITGGFLV